MLISELISGHAPCVLGAAMALSSCVRAKTFTVQRGQCKCFMLPSKNLLNRTGRCKLQEVFV